MISDERARARAAVEWLEAHRQPLFDFLQDLVADNSVFPGELSIQRDVIEPFMDQEMSFDELAGINVCQEADRLFVVGSWKGVGGGRALLLNGHIDAVGARGVMREHWSTDPWKPIIRNARLYGRDASDMKGGVAAMLWAVRALMATGVTLAGEVLVEIVPGEETSGRCAGAILFMEDEGALPRSMSRVWVPLPSIAPSSRLAPTKALCRGTLGSRATCRIPVGLQVRRCALNLNDCLTFMPRWTTGCAYIGLS